MFLIVLILFGYNTSMGYLPELFYMNDVTDVARALLGKRLVRLLDGSRLSGIICETEAYRGEEDLACHARSGRTPRNAVMYGRAGRAYIYFTYGMHWCLNAVCGAEGYPAAVLFRAIAPDEGLDVIAGRRAGVSTENWCNGPAKLCKALAINGSLNGNLLTDSNGELYIEDGSPVDEEVITASARVGIRYAPEPWRSMPWRFSIPCCAGV